MFLAVTMVNRATLVSFTAIIAGIGAVALSAWASAAFVAGVGMSSAAWQMVLVGAGGALRVRVGRRFHQATVVVGNGLVAAFGVIILMTVVLR